jgi:hypothetical protein
LSSSTLNLPRAAQQFYTNEPMVNITDPKQRALVLGGEVCMSVDL